MTGVCDCASLEFVIVHDGSLWLCIMRVRDCASQVFSVLSVKQMHAAIGVKLYVMLCVSFQCRETRYNRMAHQWSATRGPRAVKVLENFWLMIPHHSAEQILCDLVIFYQQFLYFFWYFADRASHYIYLNINQLDALNFIMSLFHPSTCFEHMCSSSGGQNCTTCIQSLVSSHL